MIKIGSKRLVKAEYNGHNIIRILVNGNNIVFTNAEISILGPDRVNAGDTNNYVLTINNKQYGNTDLLKFNNIGEENINLIYNTFKSNKEIEVSNITVSI